MHVSAKLISLTCSHFDYNFYVHYPTYYEPSGATPDIRGA